MRAKASLWIALLGAAATAAAQAPADSQTVRRAAVTAVTQGTIYIDAGRSHGLREGAAVRVPRLGSAGQYVVAYLSSRSAACQGDSLSVLPVVGDSVEFVPVRDAVVAAGDPGVRAPRRAGSRLRGRLGIRYLSFSDRSTGMSLRQPGFELSLDGPVTPGSALALAVDVRSRRTSTYRPGVPTSTEGLMGVYRAAFRIQSPRGPFRAVVGRQYAPVLAGVGLYDGLLIDVQGQRWAGGVLGGLAPELGTLAVSSEILQVGGYLQHRSRPAAGLRWSLTTGAMASYARGEVNREFGFLQGTLYGRAVSIVALQEVDLNRGWKADAGESRLVPTSTFLSVSLMPSEKVSLNGGLDNRRNVRLYRDLTTPEELFDDRFRLGMWGGMQARIGRSLQLGGDVRTSSIQGADSLRSTAFSGVASMDRLTGVHVGWRLRATRYETPGRTPGWLFAGAVRAVPGGLASLELSGGRRGEQGMPATERTWAGLNADLVLRRSWLVLFSFSREWGRDGLSPTTDQLYTGLSYRF
ncbi:MAG TPA: hypothetical protein VFN96_02165 [Gemmatimonadales bacterium]|nr:hypothetical protein [Gemmatimonadales bacterium]